MAWRGSDGETREIPPEHGCMGRHGSHVMRVVIERHGSHVVSREARSDTVSMSVRKRHGSHGTPRERHRTPWKSPSKLPITYHDSATHLCPTARRQKIAGFCRDGTPCVDGTVCVRGFHRLTNSECRDCVRPIRMRPFLCGEVAAIGPGEIRNPISRKRHGSGHRAPCAGDGGWPVTSPIF